VRAEEVDEPDTAQDEEGAASVAAEGRALEDEHDGKLSVRVQMRTNGQSTQQSSRELGAFFFSFSFAAGRAGSLCLVGSSSVFRYFHTHSLTHRHTHTHTHTCTHTHALFLSHSFTIRILRIHN
jgi:hypothetical protein